MATPTTRALTQSERTALRDAVQGVVERVEAASGQIDGTRLKDTAWSVAFPALGIARAVVLSQSDLAAVRANLETSFSSVIGWGLTVADTGVDPATRAPPSAVQLDRYATVLSNHAQLWSDLSSAYSQFSVSSVGTNVLVGVASDLAAFAAGVYGVVKGVAAGLASVTKTASDLLGWVLPALGLLLLGPPILRTLAAPAGARLQTAAGELDSGRRRASDAAGRAYRAARGAR